MAIEAMAEPLMGTVRGRIAAFSRWQQAVARAAIRALQALGISSVDLLCAIERGLLVATGVPLRPSRWDSMTINDKVTYRRLTSRDPRLVTCSDKLAMRQEVAGVLGASSLVPILAVIEHPRELDAVRGPCMLKANHGSHLTLRVDEPGPLSSEAALEAARWLAIDYSARYLEWAYHEARTAVVVEELLPASDVLDVKLHAFFGATRFIEIHGVPDGRLWWLFDTSWQLLGSHAHPQVTVPLPKRPVDLEAMIEQASMLGRDDGYLRVDFMATSTKTFVGELTVYPGAGFSPGVPTTLDAIIGRHWAAPERNDLSLRAGSHRRPSARGG